MADRGFSKIRSLAVLFTASLVLVVVWAGPALAEEEERTGGVFKFVGASYTQELRFAACMRRHGKPSFPDPNSNGVFTVRIDLNSPSYLRAQKACQYLLPKGHPLSAAQQAAALDKAFQFAQCMRSHGVPNFPDPKAIGGGLSFSLSGIDLYSPLYLRAQKVCRYLSRLGGPFGAEP